ncbi:MAG TPA: hypothetical protein DEP38_09175, partial [Cyanobacteria bacterium UBA9226]|nr:hypothetical protein [Cyanobacteria bacterium UBA9226]
GGLIFPELLGLKSLSCKGFHDSCRPVRQLTEEELFSLLGYEFVVGDKSPTTIANPIFYMDKINIYLGKKT